MCGIVCIVGDRFSKERLGAMVAALRHRGPDARDTYIDPRGGAGLGHTRLSIVDLSDAGRQPLADPSGRYRIVFNGEIYNYVELRRDLEGGYPFRSRTDTEVLLAAYLKWGAGSLDRLIGMFAFAVWDGSRRTLFAARDRFGVKPLYLGREPDGTILLASEIKALHAAGFPAEPDPVAWATYLSSGHYEHSTRTFWKDVRSLTPGHYLTLSEGTAVERVWYDLSSRVAGGTDARPEAEVREEYHALLKESIGLRFRSDVPVGINLSGGLDSSLLFATVRESQGPDADVTAFTFVTGDERYDELPWVQEVLAGSGHPLVVCPLSPGEVPDLASSVQASQDEPYGGIPTLAYARLFETARARGRTVLLDGQGMDEQWAGYDYYAAPAEARCVQGASDPATRPGCLTSEFLALAEAVGPPRSDGDPVLARQVWDIEHGKLPRALRMCDRISMRSSTELREPFLDHRLVELALRQPTDRKIRGGVHKWLIRELVEDLLPGRVRRAVKRPLQTPQREWLRSPIREWANDLIESAVARHGGAWLDGPAVRREWDQFCLGRGDNSYFAWQWITLGLMSPAPSLQPPVRPAFADAACRQAPTPAGGTAAPVHDEAEGCPLASETPSDDPIA